MQGTRVAGVLVTVAVLVVAAFTAMVAYAAQLEVPQSTERTFVFDAKDLVEPVVKQSEPVHSAKVVIKEEPEPEVVEPVEEYVEVYEDGFYYDEYDPDPNNNPAYLNGGFKSAGVVWDEDGNCYTWYSQRVLDGSGLTELNSNGRTVNGDGFVTDGDGYLAVAYPGDLNDPDCPYSIGDVVQTPWGDAKVYDSNPGGSSWDMYTDF